MTYTKQVDNKHYAFETYMTKERWCSVWHQVDEIQKLKPSKILEIGAGTGLFKAVCAVFGHTVETLDIDPDLNPDHVGTVTEMPFPNVSYDVVCAFQVLEHLPYVSALSAFSEMVRVSNRYIILSLPDDKKMLRYKFYIPKVGEYDLLLPHPFKKHRHHQFDGEHYWEINKCGYELDKVIKDFSICANLTNTYLVRDNPYHRFFIFERDRSSY